MWATDTTFFIDKRYTKSKLKWLYYILSSLDLDNFSSDTAIPGISREKIYDKKIFVASIDVQNKIANYLDRKTSEIDRLITAKKNLLSLLDEKKQALIAHAVTRGLDPDVGLKDSGIPWLGLIPEHWEPKPLKRLFKHVKRQNHPSHEVLSVYRDYGVIKKSSRDDNNNKTPEDLSVYQLVEKGDLVINKMKAWQGSLGVSDYFGITSPDYVVYRAVHSENDRFLHHSLRSPFMPSVYGSISNGIRPSQWRIEPNKFEQLLFFFPPKNEQERIVKYIDSALEKMDKLSSNLSQSITLLQERRGALISAAVTGKIEQEDLDAD